MMITYPVFFLVPDLYTLPSLKIDPKHKGFPRASLVDLFSKRGMYSL